MGLLLALFVALSWQTMAFENCTFQIVGDPRDTPGPENSTVQNEWKRLIEAELYKKAGIHGYVYETSADAGIEALDSNHTGSKGCRPSTYGELDHVRIFEHPSFALRQGDILMDLGSGVGKSVIGAALFYGASPAIGIELSDMRFKRACQALSGLEKALQTEACGVLCKRGVAMHGEVQMLHANVLEVEFWNVTAVTMYANCFPPELQLELQHKLLRQLPLGARVHTTDNSGWDKQLVLEGRTFALIPRAGMVLYRVEERRDSRLSEL